MSHSEMKRCMSGERRENGSDYIWGERRRRRPEQQQQKIGGRGDITARRMDGLKEGQGYYYNGMGTIDKQRGREKKDGRVLSFW